ncbi:MAG: DUF167 family protein [Lentisphaeria bacterium]|nr:DUF167 family protein [Lentisphaeria bacterium]
MTDQTQTMRESPPWLIPLGEASRLRLRVQPGASRSEVSGVYGDWLKVRVAAPPVDGAANREVIRFFAKLFKLPKSAVILERGQGARAKLIKVPLPAGRVMEILG